MPKTRSARLDARRVVGSNLPKEFELTASANPRLLCDPRDRTIQTLGFETHFEKDVVGEPDAQLLVTRAASGAKGNRA
jgi:hypothetical protein